MSLHGTYHVGWPLRWLRSVHASGSMARAGASVALGSAPKVSLALSNAAPAHSVFTAEERVALAESCRWVQKATLVDAATAGADEDEDAASVYIRQRTFDAAQAASGKLALFDVEATERPEAPTLTSRFAMPSGRLFAQFAAQNAKSIDAPGADVSGTVYVHGTFDLLSPGDVEFLRCARKMGRRLVVGVLADDEICRVVSNRGSLLLL